MRTATFTILLILSAAQAVHAHATLLSPKPRTKLTLKDGPCGGVRRTDQPLVLEAGSDLTVTWEEYVDHPGFYRILFSRAADANFEVLLDNIADRKSSFEEPTVRYTSRVTLPEEPCEEGTLLLIQVMMENPSDPKYYYSCADIRLIPPEPRGLQFLRGDANEDGELDVSDAIRTFLYLFNSGVSPVCADASDSNDDGLIDLSDGVYLLRWLFTSGEEPGAPGVMACGFDPTDDALPDCEYRTGLCGEG